MTWIVYGLYADRVLQYIGITQNPTRRRSRHAIDLMAGREFNMRTLTRAGSRQDAEAIEADYIRKRHPPLNTAHRDRPKQTITHVRTFWIDHGGERREGAASAANRQHLKEEGEDHGAVASDNRAGAQAIHVLKHKLRRDGRDTLRAGRCRVILLRRLRTADRANARSGSGHQSRD